MAQAKTFYTYAELAKRNTAAQSVDMFWTNLGL
jgi:hypothetical protein